MKQKSSLPPNAVKSTFLTDSTVIVTRKAIKPSFSLWYKELGRISFSTKQTIFAFSSFVTISLIFVSLLIYVVDKFSLEVLRAFAGSGGIQANFVIVVIIFTSLITIWTSLRKPPPGGAGVLLGGNDEATWQASTNFFFSFLSIAILMTICAFFWFIG